MKGEDGGLKDMQERTTRTGTKGKDESGRMRDKGGSQSL
jgi:hypothetical protein